MTQAYQFFRYLDSIPLETYTQVLLFIVIKLSFNIIYYMKHTIILESCLRIFRQLASARGGPV